MVLNDRGDQVKVVQTLINGIRQAAWLVAGSNAGVSPCSSPIACAHRPIVRVFCPSLVFGHFTPVRRAVTRHPAPRIEKIYYYYFKLVVSGSVLCYYRWFCPSTRIRTARSFRFVRRRGRNLELFLSHRKLRVRAFE